MIDTLIKHKKNFIKPNIFIKENLKPHQYFVLTMHSPANVDEQNKLKDFLQIIDNNVNELPVVFPVHPRTKNILNNLKSEFAFIKYVDPLPYLEFNYLVSHCKCVITDSGGITEEATVMGIPCITLRDNTERPETVIEGSNELIGTKPEKLIPALEKVISGGWKKSSIPKYWDGKTSERIVDKLIDLI